MGGKAKQVYVEKRKKREEEWKQRRKQHKQEEAWWGLTFWGKHTKLEKCIEQEINIPTLNEQLLQAAGLSIYEGLQGSDPEVLRFVILPLSLSLSIFPPGQRLLSYRRDEALEDELK